MGYDLHITRKSDSADVEGPRIDLSEWEAIVESEPELSLDASTRCDEWVFASFRGEEGALAWEDGQIHAKNPDHPLIIKMVAIANRLNAEVQGDDGEVYDDDVSAVRPDSAVLISPAPGLIERIRAWIRQRAMARTLRRSAPPFRVGDRVKNVWGELGTVISVDARINKGLGSVVVRLDDGREHNLACIASGLQIVSTSTVES
jgi:hypothetical protein